MAARNTAPMFSGGAASSRVSGIGGSPGGKQPTQPGLAVASGTPIFVAEKLFDEFSLGRINAGSAHHSPSSSGDFSRSGGAATGGAARIGKASEGSSGSGGGGDAGTFQPSAPPFECIGRSNVELYGFNDIFGGVPGIKSKNGGGEDDIFLMPGGATGGASSSSSPRGVGGGSGGSGAAPTHQRSSSSPLGFESRARSSDRSDAETNQSHQHTSSTGTGTGTGIGKTGSPLISDTPPPPPPPPTSYSPKPVRDREGSSSSSSAGPHGTSRLRHSGTTDAKVAAGTSDRPHQRGDSSSQTQQNKTPPYAVKPPPERGSSSHQPISGSSHHPSSAASSHHPSSAAPSHHPVSAPPQPDSARVASPPPPPPSAAAGSTAAGSTAATMPSCLPSVTSCSPRLGSGEKLSSSESGDMKAQLNRMPVFDAAAETRSGSDRIKEKPSAADEVLLPREINSSSSSSKIKPDSGNGNSSPRKSKRQSATERLKAVFFPDLGKKEEKSKSKSWFTVGDLKLVTQPTEVPPPNRAPPEMVDPAQESNPVPKLRRDERWRRNSCEFPLGKGSLKEAPVPQPQAEDLAGLSSSAMAMKEAVERAEAKLRQKKKSAEVFPEMIETETEKQQRVGSKPDDLRSDIRSDHRAGEIDKRAVERAAHELREKALKKAAERAVAAAETGRSNSAPKQRISDEAERNAKKVFFSGEQCKPVSKAETTSSNSEPVANGNLEKEKKQRKESIDRALEERAARALAEKNQRELTAQQEREERQRVSAAVDAQINAWVSGKEGNLRALLSSLQNVLWPGSGWQPVPSSELTNEASVKKAYRKATLCVHPDKVQQRTTQQKLVAEKVFDLLKAAWTKFNSQEAFFMQVS